MSTTDESREFERLSVDQIAALAPVLDLEHLDRVTLGVASAAELDASAVLFFRGNESSWPVLRELRRQVPLDISSGVLLKFLAQPSPDFDNQSPLAWLMLDDRGYPADREPDPERLRRVVAQAQQLGNPA
ncbi:MAG TPA: hypothetical protein VLI05_06795 [Candidatus Saccharimonadia bacterium]|nr:hypothetical protein [Candidatus Saccharimonadia bacterium]